MIYTSLNEKYSVIVSAEIVRQLIDYITVAKRNETGGIMIGQYNDARDCATISMVTPAPLDSKCGHTWFDRGVNGLQQLIGQMWKKKKYYLGEWHFHPFASPTPSSPDINQMVKIAGSKQYRCPEPILLIIGGSPSIFKTQVSIILANKAIIELIPQESE